MSEELEEPVSTTRCLIIYWDTTDNSISLDTKGLSIFDVPGLLAVALDIAASEMPFVGSGYEEEEETSG